MSLALQATADRPRVIVATPARSGSHFVVDLLREAGLAGGGEVAFQGRDKAEVARELEEAFDTNDAIILHLRGFPGHRPAWFVDLLREKRIKVISGRRSGLMVVSNDHLARAARREGGEGAGDLGRFLPLIRRGNTTVAERFASLTARNLLEPTPQTRKLIRRKESAVDEARAYLTPLSADGLLHCHDYEDLVTADRVSRLAALFAFVLGGSPADMTKRAAAAFDKVSGADACRAAYLHPPTCASRADDWPRLRELLKFTHAGDACERVDAFFETCGRARRRLTIVPENAGEPPRRRRLRRLPSSTSIAIILSVIGVVGIVGVVLLCASWFACLVAKDSTAVPPRTPTVAVTPSP